MQLDVPALSFGSTFASRGTITGGSGRGSGDNTLAVVEEDEPGHADHFGGHSVWLEWIAPETGIVRMNTLGSGIDTLLAVYRNGSADGQPVDIAELISVAEDDDGGAFNSSTIEFNAITGTTYYIAIDGFSGETGAVLLEWELEPRTELPPVIVKQPQSRSVIPGTDVQFVVEATGVGLTYKWFINGNAINGATGPVLSILNARPGAVGVFAVEVTGSNGLKVLSREAELQLHQNLGGLESDEIFAQDKLEFAIPLTGQIQLAGEGSRPIPGPDGNRASPVRGNLTPAAAFRGAHFVNTEFMTRDQGEPLHCDLIGGKSVWFAFEPPEDGFYQISTLGSDYPTVIEVYRGPTNPLGYFELNRLDPRACAVVNGPDGLGSEVVFQAQVQAGQLYFVAVDGLGGESGLLALNYRLAEAPSPEPLPATFTVTQGAGVKLEAAVDGEGVEYQWLYNGARIVGETNAVLTLNNYNTEDGGSYEVVISNFAGSTKQEVAVAYVALPEFDLASAFHDGQFHLRLNGDGEGYVFEGSADLKNWIPISTNTPVGGVIDYTDPDSGVESLRYYRAVPVQ